jgi:hypothetical protein
MTIVDVAEIDLDLLVKLNNAEYPQVNRIDRHKADWLKSHAVLFKGAKNERRLTGFIVALLADSGYQSPYFSWFKAFYDQFLYIDRVVIVNGARRTGLGAALYGQVEEVARRLQIPVVCEVYCDPPNVPSLRFHQKLGFRELGRQKVEGGQKTVLKLVKEIR